MIYIAEMGHKHRHYIEEIKKSNMWWIKKKHVYDPKPKYCGDPCFMIEAYEVRDLIKKLNTGQQNAK